MENISRRDFGIKLLSSLVSYSLVKTAFERDLFAQSIKPVTDKWLKSIHELCGDLRTVQISQTDWQAAIGRLHARVPLAEMLRFLDFDKFEKQLEMPSSGVASRVFQFPQIEWLPGPDTRGWGMSIFSVDPGAAVTPHGHDNMVSAHLVLKGELRVRHYDRVADETGHWLIRPTIDRLSVPGDETSISQKKDNVHWLKNSGRERAYTLDVVVAALDPALDYSFRQTFLDPEGGEKLKNGLIRARKLTYQEAFDIYGKKL